MQESRGGLFFTLRHQQPLWSFLQTGVWQILLLSKIELTLLWLPETLDWAQNMCRKLPYVGVGTVFSSCISKGSATMSSTQKLLPFGCSASFASPPFYCCLCLVMWYWLLWSCLVTLWVITTNTIIVPWYHISQAKFSIPLLFPSSNFIASGIHWALAIFEK